MRKLIFKNSMFHILYFSYDTTLHIFCTKRSILNLSDRVVSVFTTPRNYA
jgi:hypothetical protein